jgi:hypothetical protein
MVETNEGARSRRGVRPFLATSKAPAGEPFSPAGVDSLSDIMARARSMAAVYNGTANEETLAQARGEYWIHPVWGRMFIGPMPAVGYAELERASQSPLNRKRHEDLVYLHRGVLAPQFSPENVTELYDTGDGPATQELIAAIKRWNPDFHEKQDWVTACIGTDRLVLMFITCAIQMRLWPELTELFEDGAELSEEQQAKRLVFERLLRYLPIYCSVMGINELSQELDIPLTTAGAKAALEAKRRLEESGANQALPPI